MGVVIYIEDWLAARRAGETPQAKWEREMQETLAQERIARATGKPGNASRILDMAKRWPGDH